MISQKKSAINKIVRCLFHRDVYKNSDPKHLMKPKGWERNKKKVKPKKWNRRLKKKKLQRSTIKDMTNNHSKGEHYTKQTKP